MKLLYQHFLSTMDSDIYHTPEEAEQDYRADDHSGFQQRFTASSKALAVMAVMGHPLAWSVPPKNHSCNLLFTNFFLFKTKYFFQKYIENNYHL